MESGKGYLRRWLVCITYDIFANEPIFLANIFDILENEDSVRSKILGAWPESIVWADGVRLASVRSRGGIFELQAVSSRQGAAVLAASQRHMERDQTSLCWVVLSTQPPLNLCSAPLLPPQRANCLKSAVSRLMVIRLRQFATKFTTNAFKVMTGPEKVGPSSQMSSKNHVPVSKFCRSRPPLFPIGSRSCK